MTAVVCRGPAALGRSWATLERCTVTTVTLISALRIFTVD
jgi:hypothetical protein